MKGSKRPFTVVFVFFAVFLLLSITAINARDADRNSDIASRTFVAAQTASRQCMNTCRAHYRDCRRLNQLPSYECQGVYHDCIRYSCTGLGPG